MAVKKQKKISGVVNSKKLKKRKLKLLPNTIEDGLPGQEDVLLDQVATKNHPEYPDRE